MKILIVGGTGLLGQAVIQRLVRDGHECSVLSRKSGNSAYYKVYGWNPQKKLIDVAALKNQDVIINLSGAGIASSRWTRKRKQILYESRVYTTNLLFENIRKLKRKPQRIISSSAIGYYGHRPSEILSEEMEKGKGYLSDLCNDWEKSAQFSSLGISTAIIRTGIVLSNKGGSLPAFKMPVKYGLNVLFGDGNHFISWIHIDDLVNAVIYLINNNDEYGTFNLTSPNPVTQKTLNQELKRLLGKKTLRVRLPSGILKIMFGEMSELFLNDIQVYPERLNKLGFNFKFPDLQAALTDLLKVS